MYSALEVADHIVLKCIEDKRPVNNIRLQSILYILQRHYLRAFGGRLFSDELEAWQFGPVVPYVYYKFCGYGATEITWLSRCRDMNPQIKAADKEVIDPLVEKLSELKPWELYKMVSHEGGAWHTLAYTKDPPKFYGDTGFKNRLMPIELITAKG